MRPPVTNSRCPAPSARAPPSITGREAAIAGRRSVTADTALRLARAFKTGPEVCLNLQQIYGLRVAEFDKKSGRAAVKPIKTNAA